MVSRSNATSPKHQIMVSLKQELSVLDYFGPLCVFVSFFVIVFLISVTCILWFCVSDVDDVNVFTKFPVVVETTTFDVKLAVEV
uniref:Transmembrane protein n=1 Tax=Romanomermis culicivorax TaxID=13658 RepID=A0A915HQI5_ROMCU